MLIGRGLYSRYQWNPNADWAGIIQSIQSKLSCNPKYELDEEEIPMLEQHMYSKTKPAAVIHPQDLRVREIRTLLGYPVDLVKEWLAVQGVERPSQLDTNKVNELVKTMCLSWASGKIDNAEPSYQEQVADVVVFGNDEVVAIKSWMQQILQPMMANSR